MRYCKECDEEVKVYTLPGSWSKFIVCSQCDNIIEEVMFD